MKSSVLSTVFFLIFLIFIGDVMAFHQADEEVSIYKVWKTEWFSARNAGHLDYDSNTQVEFSRWVGGSSLVPETFTINGFGEPWGPGGLLVVLSVVIVQLLI